MLQVKRSDFDQSQMVLARRQGQSISEMVQLAGNLSKYILTVVYIGKNHQALTRYWMAPVFQNVRNKWRLF